MKLYRRRRTQLPVPRPLDNHPNGERLRDDPDPEPPVAEANYPKISDSSAETDEVAVRALVETAAVKRTGRRPGVGEREQEARRLRAGRG